EAGRDASFVLMQARYPIEDIRLRATRLKVWRKGQLLAETPPSQAALSLAGRPAVATFMPVRG
ncbi:MAG: cytosine deaminase, partial [Hydrogenophaga sp.]|nr:cytosine deaminase [Hydrogenophaga sp.]